MFDLNDSTKLSVALAIFVIGIGSVFMKTPQKEKPEEEEDTWESHIPSRHGELEEVYPGKLYRLEAAGCSYGPPTRNMTIYVNDDEQQNDNNNKLLLIVSAIAVREDTLQEILSLGTPSVLVIPNGMHRCCAGVWKQRFPDILVVCPDFQIPKGRETIEEVIQVDKTMDELCQLPAWKNALTPRRLDGWKHFEEILEVRLEQDKKAMIVTDLLFTTPSENGGWVTSMIQWFFDSVTELPSEGSMTIPKITRMARWFTITDWKKAEEWYRAYAQEEGANIAVILAGHGPPIREMEAKAGCKDALVGVADQLVTPRW